MSAFGSLGGVARWLAAVLGALGSIVLLVVAVDRNWDAARPESDAPVQRLRWYVKTRTPLGAGRVLTKEDLQLTLGRLPDRVGYVRTVNDAVGRYLTREVEADVPLREDQISMGAAASAGDGSAIVPVEVSTDHIAGLVPGMHLAFAGDKAMIPTAEDLARPKPEPAFTLLAIGPSTRTPANTSLLVLVPKCRLPLAGRLGSGSWRPVILGPVQARTLQ